MLVDEFVYVINNEKFKSGVYSIEDKKQIISSNYEIISIEYEHFWKDRTEDKEKAFIKFDIFQDKNNKLYYLSKNYQLSEIKRKSNLNIDEKQR